MPLITTTIGSYPKPAGLKIPNWFEVRRAHSPGERHPTKAYDAYLAERDPSEPAAIGKATVEIVREQVEAGIDVPTDGETPREHYIYYQCRNFLGFDFNRLTRRAMRGGSWSAEVPTIIGVIRSRSPILVRDWQIAQSATDKPVKMTLPGPLTIIDSTANDHYDDEERLACDLADALNAEAAALAAAGCRWISGGRTRVRGDPERALRYEIDALSRCFYGVRGRTKSRCLLRLPVSFGPAVVPEGRPAELFPVSPSTRRL